MFFSVIAVLLVSRCLAATAEDEKVRLLRLGIKCREENRLRGDQVEQLRHRVETSDGNVKCFLKCMMVGMNLMNESGEITVEGAEGDSAEASKFREWYAACKDVTGTDPCDKALSFHNCVWNQKSPQEGEEEPPN